MVQRIADPGASRLTLVDTSNILILSYLILSYHFINCDTEFYICDLQHITNIYYA